MWLYIHFFAAGSVRSVFHSSSDQRNQGISPMNNQGGIAQDLDEEMPTPGSPAPSLYSFHSSLDGRVMLRNLHGRILNNSNELYMFPADGEEHDRLDLQHAIYTLSLESLYPARDSVRKALAPRQFGSPAILDVGTGSGSWALAMANEFPHCEVVGVDLAPVRLAIPLPSNCRFEIDDANLGFAHYQESFDVVHARAVGVGIRDFLKLLSELASVVRPGGVLLFADGEMQLYDEQQQPLPVAEPGEEPFSWTQLVFHATYNSMKTRGSQVDTSSLLPLWLSRMEELENAGSQKIFIPLGPWRKGDPREEAVSDMLRTNALMHLMGMRPLLRDRHS
ncbi:S-adenosyl-L-methionine-dependent methyltransferase [Gautieria morchelliformis]|nr:S-adenosyl-L-methionine-dependent methyltransferase [Gautieria morchelliformis]